VVTYTATATDDVDGPITPTCTPASGTTFAPGTTTVTCTATDAAGNTATASFTVTIEGLTPDPVILLKELREKVSGAANLPRGLKALLLSQLDASRRLYTSPPLRRFAVEPLRLFILTVRIFDGPTPGCPWSRAITRQQSVEWRADAREIIRLIKSSPR
jgi:hypothetical protein